MKPDKLEQFILNNKKSFGSPEPTPDVWHHIKKRQPKKDENKFNWKYVISRAAAVTLIFISSYYFHAYRSNINTKNQEQYVGTFQKNDTIYLEFLEAENYYKPQIEYKKKELFKLIENTPKLQKDINTDMSELNNNISELKSDLKDNAANQRIIEAMIQNYKLKIEILEDMLNQVKSNNKQNYTHETTFSI